MATTKTTKTTPKTPNLPSKKEGKPSGKGRANAPTKKGK